MLLHCEMLITDWDNWKALSRIYNGDCNCNEIHSWLVAKLL